MGTPRAVLFDLGGVLLNVDLKVAFDAWAHHTHLTSDEVAARFRALPFLEDHERGRIDDATFFARLRRELELSASTEAVESAWNSVFVGEIGVTRRLVQRARLFVPCFALTNTTASHLATWPSQFPDLRACFDQVFASFQIGRRKPDAEAFNDACVAMGQRPQDVLFFDDSATNAVAAEAVGLQTVLVRGPADVQDALRRHGFLQAET